MSMAIFIILLVGGMIGGAVYIGIRTKYWHLLYVFLTFYACFGLWEWHATATTGKTVSQQVWYFGEINPGAFWPIMILFLISWVALLYHFSEKKLKR